MRKEATVTKTVCSKCGKDVEYEGEPYSSDAVCYCEKCWKEIHKSEKKKRIDQILYAKPIATEWDEDKFIKLHLRSENGDDFSIFPNGDNLGLNIIYRRGEIK